MDHPSSMHARYVYLATGLLMGALGDLNPHRLREEKYGTAITI